MADFFGAPGLRPEGASTLPLFSHSVLPFFFSAHKVNKYFKLVEHSQIFKNSRPLIFRQ